jgi:penicillin-binding protein 2
LFIKERLLKVLALLALIYLCLGGVLFYHQVINGKNLAQEAAAIRTRKVSVRDIPRGEILDRNGIPLTGNYTVWAACCLPRLITDAEQVSVELASVLRMDAGRLQKDIKRAARRGEFFLTVKHPLDNREREALIQARIPGVFLNPVKQRYSSDGFCLHLIGQTIQADAGAGEGQEWAGASGIEKRYDEELKESWHSEELVAVLDARGGIIPGLFGKIDHEWKEAASQRVVMTIDYKVQQLVEKAMEGRVKKGAVVVMDVGSRDILALASRPVFNPYKAGESLAEARDSPFLNRAFGLYHPGSIFKLVVAAAALEAGLVAEDDIFDCTGSHVFNDQVSIACWKEGGHGMVKLPEALANSCNSAFIEIGSRVGRKQLLQYARRLQIMDTRIVGYPGVEGGGYVRIEPGAPALGNACIGQEGVMLTPVQVASLITTIADDGQWRSPRLVKGIQQLNGRWEQAFEPGGGTRVISRPTARQLQDMLCLAVEEGTGSQARTSLVGCAGKTASSQTGQFSVDGAEHLDTWFAGYFPTDDPRWVVVVLVEDGVSGGRSCAPVFKEIAEGIINFETAIIRR